jgi:hypothetical protein
MMTYNLFFYNKLFNILKTVMVYVIQTASGHEL